MNKTIGVFAMLLLAVGVVAAAGFDQYGYNDKARIFVGTGMSWCMDKFDNEAFCEGYLGVYTDDKLVMKWNAEWDRGNDEQWADGPYDAWLSNEWNGKKGGSGEVWHSKIVWVGDCVADPSLVPEGGYCIWGQFADVLDHGTSAEHEHSFLAHASPAGYGVAP